MGPDGRPKVQNRKAQSAMEYLMTYGWAILVLAIVLASLFAINVFNPNTFAPNFCIFPASFSCVVQGLSHTTGNVAVTVGQSLQAPINITAVGCNDQGTITGMISYMPASSNIYLGIGGNYTFNAIPCYKSGAVVSGTAGTLYTGYVVVSYTNLQTGFSHTAIAKLSQKLT
jgi:hypothetical protein